MNSKSHVPDDDEPIEFPLWDKIPSEEPKLLVDQEIESKEEDTSEDVEIHKPKADYVRHFVICVLSALALIILLLIGLRYIRDENKEDVKLPVSHPQSVFVSPRLKLPQYALGAQELALVFENSHESYEIVSKQVRTGRQFPNPDQVQLSEWLHLLKIQASQRVAIHEGCLLSYDFLPMAASNPTSAYVLVSVCNSSLVSKHIEVVFHPNPIHCNHLSMPTYQLSKTPLNHELELSPGTSVAVILRVEYSEQELGTFAWSVDRRAAPLLGLEAVPANPSDDNRWASLLCHFGLWIQRDSSISSQQIKNELDECMKNTPEQQDLSELIQQTIDL